MKDGDNMREHINIKNEHYTFKFRVSGVIVRDGKVLLVEMDNAGFFCLPGGHVELGETPFQAVVREVKEETGLDLKSAEYRCVINFVNDDYDEIIYQYTSSDFSGEVIECNEGELKWIPKEEVLSLPMWEGDKYFLAPLINNEPFFEITIVYKNNKLLLVDKK